MGRLFGSALGASGGTAVVFTNVAVDFSGVLSDLNTLK